MILQTQENVMKTTNCFVSDTVEIARVLYIKTKEEIGLEKMMPLIIITNPIIVHCHFIAKYCCKS
jgi:hypothetical protein